MKQLKKLGFQRSRVLTEDQMKNVKGGEPSRGCSSPGPRMLCGAALCEVTDAFGRVMRGVCTSSCVCDTAGIIPPTIN